MLNVRRRKPFCKDSTSLLDLSLKRIWFKMRTSNTCFSLTNSCRYAMANFYVRVSP